ncbi:MAG: cobalamin B12-binding domain-containing protein [Elusimicrobia bacterium]|nr:cobalamin B12-binding domain-containing protein [Elusimicrobiota bacterium]
MRVLLVQPPFTIFVGEARFVHPPLGLAYLAAVLRRHHDVQILDALIEGHEQEELSAQREQLTYGLSEAQIAQRLRMLRPQVIGVSCPFSSQSANAARVCRIAKGIDPRVITVMGGAHPSAAPEKVLSDSNVDFVVLGEAEDAFPSLLASLERGQDVKPLPGIAFNEGGVMRINPRAPLISNLDLIPIPDWSGFPLADYFRVNMPHTGPVKRKRFLPLITSRGCPFTCSFCSIHTVWGRQYRLRSVGNVLAEMDMLVEKYGIREILFEDDNLTLNKTHATAVFRGMIDRRYDLTWSTPNGLMVETLDERLLALMKEAGCHRITLAIESGDEEILRGPMRKPLHLRRVRPVLKWAKRLGLRVVGLFVVGMPQETRAQTEETFRLAAELDLDYRVFSFATPLPGTELMQYCLERGLWSENMNYSFLRPVRPSVPTIEMSRMELLESLRRWQSAIDLKHLARHPLRAGARFAQRVLRIGA